MGRRKRQAWRAAGPQLRRYGAVELALDRCLQGYPRRVRPIDFFQHYLDTNHRLCNFCSNVEIISTFTSSASELAFFYLSLLCELHAPALLRLMSATLDESFFADPLAIPRISAYLVQIASIVDDLTAIVTSATITKSYFGPREDARIVPEVFYWEIRPWFNGGLWTYEGVPSEVEGEENGCVMEWGGPSAGQSSLIHAVDLFLSIDHSPRPSAPPLGDTSPASSSLRPSRSMTAEKSREPPSSDSTFMTRAALYMPFHHRAFLAHLSSLHLRSPSNSHPIPSVRSLALTHRPQLGESYDQAVTAMKVFRDLHMRLVSVFIVSQAKKPPGPTSVFWADFETRRVESEREKARTEREGFVKETLIGTGGTALVSFLNECRERTKEAILQ